MAQAPLRPCATAGCPQLVRRRRRCEDHQAQADRQREQQRGSAAARGYGYRWRRLAAQAIRRQPWCSHCFATEDLTVDHPVAMARGGERLPPIEELVVLCRSCNSRKGAR